MKEPTTTDILNRIDVIAEAVAAGFAEMHEKMATKDEMNSRFEAVEERLDRIENNHVRRIENLELAAVDVRRDITTLKDHAGIE